MAHDYGWLFGFLVGMVVGGIWGGYLAGILKREESPAQSNVALAHSAFAGKTIYGDAAFPSVTIGHGAPPGVAPGYCEDSPFSVNHAELAALTQQPRICDECRKLNQNWFNNCPHNQMAEVKRESTA